MKGTSICKMKQEVITAEELIILMNLENMPGPCNTIMRSGHNDISLEFNTFKDLSVGQVNKFHTQLSPGSWRGSNVLPSAANHSPNKGQDDLDKVHEITFITPAPTFFNYTKKKQAVDSIEYARAMKELSIEVLE
jgi:hypothetical protein